MAAKSLPYPRFDAQLSSPPPATDAASDSQQHTDAPLQLFVEHMRALRRDPKTIASYCADIRIFGDAVGKSLLEVERADLYAVVEAWKQQAVEHSLSERTIARRVAAVRQLYNFLFDLGLIASRPTANLRLPKPWMKVQRAAAAEDLEQVIAAMGRVSPFELRDRALLFLLRDAGPRVNAIAQAEVADVDWKLGRVFLRHDKFGKQHYIPLSKRVIMALWEYVQNARPYFLHGRDLPYLFVAAKYNTPMTRQRIWQIADNWTRKVLSKSYSPHSWRRSCLTEAADNGMDLFDIMALAGHSDPATTQRYINHSITGLKETFNRTHPRARKESQ